MAKPAEINRKPVYLRTGTTLIDLMLAGNKGELGVLAGTVLGLSGDKSAGKTSFIMDMIANAHYELGDKFKWHYDDVERGNTYSKEQCEDIYGFDLLAPKKFCGKVLGRSHTIEELDGNVGLFADDVAEDELGVYVCDSVDGLSSNEKEAAAEKRKNQIKKNLAVKDDGTYGAEIAKFFSQQFFKTKVSVLEEKRITAILVNQVRPNMNASMFEKKEKISSGKAQEFFWTNQVHLKPVKLIFKNGLQVGAIIMAHAQKSKSPRPCRTVYYTYYSNYGIDNIGSNIDYLFDMFATEGEKRFELIDKPIIWDKGEEEENTDNVKTWLTENEYIDEYKKFAREEKGKATLTLELVHKWIAGAVKEAYEKHFGKMYTRDELIAYIESDRELELELERRVIEKWEANEEAANPVVGRKKRFADARK